MTKKPFFVALTFVALFGITVLSGCEKKTTIEGKPGEGIQIETPNTKVDIGGGKGVQVETPHTDVKVGGGKGIQLETPPQ